ncbi:MAG: RHS repeat-associated core domain-containing protein, partial [Patescibacteria group bacterium]|nr:RHS repeat-associated core domain-containing protein [Patescibacteria group bacterium]
LHLDELYEYDQLYRLINTQRGNLSANRDAITDKAFEQDWALDATGNWDSFDEDLDGDGTNDLEQTRDHNEANETGTIGATSGTNWADPSHDAVGNMTSMPKPSDLGNSISGTYDAWNRLVEVSDGGVLIAKFSYDGAGRRILKQLADSQEPDQYIHFFHSGTQVVETREGDDSAGVPDPTELPPRHQFVWSPRYVDSLILRDDYDAQGQLVAGERLFYLADANFNVTALVGLVETEPDVFEWQVVERYVYSPYGAVTIYTPDWSTVLAESAHDNTTLYTGREFDSETGLYYYRARYYHAELGQFVSRDPIGYDAGDVNLYRYVGTSPIGRTDPTGLWTILDLLWPPDCDTSEEPSQPELPTRYPHGIEGSNPQCDRLYQRAFFAQVDVAKALSLIQLLEEQLDEAQELGQWADLVTRIFRARNA